MASDVGGISEAKLACVPAAGAPDRALSTELDDQMLPVAWVPEQDLEPWRAALAALVGRPLPLPGHGRAPRASGNGLRRSG